MTQKTYRAAIIGVGKAGGGGPKGGGHAIAHTHTAMYQRNPRVTLGSGCDINPENLQFFQEKFAVPQGWADYQQMLAEYRPDIVSICTYVGLHRPMIEACAAAGVKGILCEKPFVASPADLEAVRGIVARTGIKISVAHFRRHFPGVEVARDCLNDGTIGRPLLCFGGLEDWDLSEWGAHWLDILRFLQNDRPLRYVMGQARVGDFRGYGHLMEEHAVAYFEFDNGVRGLVDGGRAIDGWDLNLVGTDGVIHLRQNYQQVMIDNAQGRRVIDCSKQLCTGWEALGLAPADGFVQAWDLYLSELIAWMEGGELARCGLPHTMGTAELNLAAYVSALRGDRVDLPLSNELLTIDRWPIDLIKQRTIHY